RLLLSLSCNQRWQNYLASVPAVWYMSRRFIAGETTEEAIKTARLLNELGIMASLHYLGEEAAEGTEARASRDAYIAALDAIASERVESNISIRLTQLGLGLDDALCYENAESIVEHAAALGNVVYIDAEGSMHYQAALDLYRRLRERHDNVGMTVQAQLFRSQSDVETLIKEGVAHLRLCKGIYPESPSVAYPAGEIVREKLLDLVRAMFRPESRQRGVYPAVATHDDLVINWVRRYTYYHRVPADAYEFQMLYGVRRDRQRWLADQGYRLRVYIPYGTNWYPYFMRRLAERPANLLFFIRALAGP
ncbi:MAG: proline dehydrogenase family protein, partial [Anaerolineae bacterium]|nr:proline dehydrogenase family protein [Anaerolineae bacterium]